MELTFNFRKTADAVALLLRDQPGRRMTCLRVLKFLYLADRELVVTSLMTVTGDQPVATRKGPVLVRTDALLNGNGEGEQGEVWKSCFHRDGHHVVMDRDPGFRSGRRNCSLPRSGSTTRPTTLTSSRR